MRDKTSGNLEQMSQMEISKVWNVLGPFQIGTREATWGVDPLEQHGGFANLQPGDESYPSSLGINGEVSWSTITAESPSNDSLLRSFDIESQSYTAVNIALAFPDIHWSTSQAVYGWSALQWQAWARGTLTIHGSEAQTVRLSLPGILEFEIDGQRHFGGDYFAFNRASLIQTLEPGTHVLNVRIARDVRAMGAIGDPIFNTDILVEQVDPGLTVLTKHAILPDRIIDHGSAGNLCSIPVQNTSKDWLEITNISMDGAFTARTFRHGSKYLVAPGQTRTVTAWVHIWPEAQLDSVQVRFHYRVQMSKEGHTTKTYVIDTKSRHIEEPHKMAFVHGSDGPVSYALVKPPYLGDANSDAENVNIPVMLVLHGAGVDIEDEETSEMLQSIGNVRAWIVLPTGGSPWSGDDWHTWGLADALAAVDYLPNYIDIVKWKRSSVDTQSIYIVGHSNGGQGTWQVLTHIPDRICAAAPISGYSSIQKYVPYDYTREVDPQISSIMQMALASYRHELLVENAKGVPIQQQHGSADDNVPTSHSRRMYQLLKEVGADTKYNEIPNKGHWYSGIMATPPLKDFYHRIAHHSHDGGNLPSGFSIVIPSTGDPIGSRGGIVVEQLQRLGQLGRIDVQRVSNTNWNVRTSNIHRLRLGHRDYTGLYPTSLHIDDDVVLLEDVSSHEPVWLYLDSEYRWKKGIKNWLYARAERFGTQFGTIQAILRKNIGITFCSDRSYNVALQISRNLYQYYSASCDIVHDSTRDYLSGHVITVKQGIPEDSEISSLLPANAVDFPIKISREGLAIKRPSGPVKTFQHRAGLGGIFLAPRNSNELQLVIWGYDKKGLEQAARLAPGLTGVGQPDFVVVGPESSWKGAGGALAMGFFDYDWSISASSYIL